MPESAATTLDELWVKFNAKFENIERGLKEMQTQGKKTDSIWKSIENTVKTVFSFFAVQRVVQWFRSLIGMGTESAREMRQVDAALAALGDRFVSLRPLIDEHAQKMIALGFDDEETARSMAHLLGVTRDWNAALEINAVAMDLAAYKGISLEAATQALSRAWAGNTRMLREFGIDVREGARGMEVLRTVAARVQGQAAASVDPLRVMGIMLQNMGEDIGQRLLPVVYNLFQAFNRLWPSIGPIIEQLAGVFGQLLDAVGPLIEALGQGLVTALRGAAPLINVITGFVGQLMQLLAPYIPMIAQFIGQVLQQAAPILQMVAEAILQVLAAVLPLVPQVLSLASLLIDMLLPVLRDLSPVFSAAASVIRLAAVAVAGLLGFIRGLIKLGGDLVKATKEQWSIIWQIIRRFAEAISKLLIGVGDVLGGIFSLDINQLKRGASAVWDALKQFGQEWIDGVTRFADNAIKTWTKTIPDGFKQAAQEAVNAAIDVYAQGERVLARFGRIGTTGQTTAGTGTTTWTPPAAPGIEWPGGGESAGEERNEALENYLKLLDHEIAMGQVSLEQQRERLREALKLTKTQDERWQIEERIYELDKQIAELPYEKRRRELDHRVAMGELTLQQQLEELKNLRNLATTEEQRWLIDEEIYELEQKIAALPYEERMRELDHRVAMGELTLEQQRAELQNLLQLNLTEEQRWQIEERIYQINEQLAEQAREHAEEARQQTEQLKQSWSSFLQDWIKGGFKLADIWDRIMARMLDKFIDTLVEMMAANDKYGLLKVLGDLFGLGVSLGGGSTPVSAGGGVPTEIPVDVPVAVAARGMVVPQTRRVVPALLHEREMVLPRHLSEGLQRLIASGGSGDTFNVTIQAVDAPSIVRLFSRPEVRGPVLKHVRDEIRQKGRV